MHGNHESDITAHPGNRANTGNTGTTGKRTGNKSVEQDVMSVICFLYEEVNRNTPRIMAHMLKQSLRLKISARCVFEMTMSGHGERELLPVNNKDIKTLNSAIVGLLSTLNKLKTP